MAFQMLGIKREEVYTDKTSKKKGRTTIEEFNKKSSGVLCTCFKADEGIIYFL